MDFWRLDLGSFFLSAPYSILKEISPVPTASSPWNPVVSLIYIFTLWLFFQSCINLLYWHFSCDITDTSYTPLVWKQMRAPLQAWSSSCLVCCCECHPSVSRRDPGDLHSFPALFNSFSGSGDPMSTSQTSRLFQVPRGTIASCGFWELSPKASLHPQLPQHNLLCIKKSEPKKKKKIRTTTGNCKNANLFRKSTLLIQNSDPIYLLWWFNANCRLKGLTQKWKPCFSGGTWSPEFGSSSSS